MTPTLYTFLQALTTPATHFVTLHEAQPLRGHDGRIVMSRTSRFAEAEITWSGARWLLCMPLVPAAIPSIERAAARLHTLRSEWIAEYRLLRDELRYEDALGQVRQSDLVLQRLPEGISFDEACTLLPREELQEALEALRHELTRLGLSHRNLKPENLRWSHGQLIPIRWHYIGTDPAEDDAAFEQLRRHLAACPSAAVAATPLVSDVSAPYGSPTDRLTGHLWVGNVFEQLVCVADREGFGFVDTANRTVIPAQYRWAGDFHEGRAPVQTDEGMGLIDKQGRYILPPRFEIVEYCPEKSRTFVREKGVWSMYDYLGRFLGPAPDGPWEEE